MQCQRSCCMQLLLQILLLKFCRHKWHTKPFGPRPCATSFLPLATLPIHQQASPTLMHISCCGILARYAACKQWLASELCLCYSCCNIVIWFGCAHWIFMAWWPFHNTPPSGQQWHKMKQLWMCKVHPIQHIKIWSDGDLSEHGAHKTTTIRSGSQVNRLSAGNWHANM